MAAGPDELPLTDVAISATPALKPRRAITAMAAVLLPHRSDGSVDWLGFEAHVARTVEAGLTPAVNMDTGFVQRLDSDTATQVLATTRSMTGGDFVAGAFVDDEPGAGFDPARYDSAISAITSHDGTPVVFPSHGLNGHGDEVWLRGYRTIATMTDRFIGFELGSAFVPYGRIVSLDTYRGLLEIDECIGAKHSSLSRQPEWDRLAIRDRYRPDFFVLTGNDLAIDMVRYGSDYLLGLATFAPAAFAARDQLWTTGDPAFFEANDLLQYLGAFAFRPPVPAYRHSAAMFLKLCGWIDCDDVPPGEPRRPDSDRAVLADIAQRLGLLA